jgi:hypothetical protein
VFYEYRTFLLTSFFCKKRKIIEQLFLVLLANNISVVFPVIFSKEHILKKSIGIYRKQIFLQEYIKSFSDFNGRAKNHFTGASW